jgi:hypothetical protein
MKKRACSYLECGKRRKHHENQDEERGTRMVEVLNSVPEDAPCYCSYTCALMDGGMDLKTGWIHGAITKSGFKIP